jgi:hypothetical protein
MATTTYRTGTITLTNGSATVTGTGTGWTTAELEAGMPLSPVIPVADGGPIQIAMILQSVEDDTEIALSAPWTGSTLEDVAYEIVRDNTGAPAYVPLVQYGDMAPWGVLREGFVRFNNAISTGFAALVDFLLPAIEEGDGGKYLRVNDEEDGTEWVDPGAALATDEAPGFMSAAHVTALAALATALDGHDIESGVWTPTFTFGTPGDLSVEYHAQVGTYLRIGNAVYVAFDLAFTPTFATASGNMGIGGLPFEIDELVTGSAVFSTVNSSTVPTFPSGTTMTYLVFSASNQLARVDASGSGAGGIFTATQLTSGVKRTIRGFGTYPAVLTP